MNKLIVSNKEKKEFDSSILLEENKLIIRKDTSLTIVYEKEKDYEIEVNPGVILELLELNFQKGISLHTTFTLQENSKVDVQKIYATDGMKENCDVFLNGEHAQFTSLLKTISTKEENYQMTVTHNAKNTESFIQNHGINVQDGSITFEVSGVIPKGISGSIMDQKNRIVTYNEKECKILPNLFVDEEDVVANHSAYIGRFKDEELFYLMSRGIDEKESTLLLTKGFLMSYLKVDEEWKQKLEEYLKKVWR